MTRPHYVKYFSNGKPRKPKKTVIKKRLNLKTFFTSKNLGTKKKIAGINFS